jgi:hypothetical protein
VRRDFGEFPERVRDLRGIQGPREKRWNSIWLSEADKKAHQAVEAVGRFGASPVAISRSRRGRAESGAVVSLEGPNPTRCKTSRLTSDGTRLC